MISGSDKAQTAMHSINLPTLSMPLLVEPLFTSVLLLATLLSFVTLGLAAVSLALALPCGVSSEGLPLSAQLLGRALDEATLLRAGAVIEAAMGTKRPTGAYGE